MINSYNEWSPLKRIVVGSATDANWPVNDPGDGRNPVYFENPMIDALVTVTMELGAAQWVQQERLRIGRRGRRRGDRGSAPAGCRRCALSVGRGSYGWLDRVERR